MELFKKALSLFLCFLMGITGPVISSALADGYGNTAASTLTPSESGNGGTPCICCEDNADKSRGSGPRRAFFYNGSEYLQATDLALPGIMPIRIQRTYNSQATFDSPLGYGWDYSFNDRLRTYADNSVVIRTTTGRKLHFVFTGGAYVCEESPHVTLNKNPDGSFLFYTSPIGINFHYDRDGRLVRKQDLNGNFLRMTYSADVEPLIGISPNSISPDTPMVVSNNHQLQRVEQFDAADTSTGRYVDFSYNGSSGRLTSITDSTGRTISYQHDASGNLIRIDYPEELFISYEYTDPSDSHNMTNNLRGYSTNAPVLLTTREYDVDDRIIREEYAGGVLEIDYTNPLQETTVTKIIVDAQGATVHQFDTIFEFNTQGYLIQTTDAEKSFELVRDSRNNTIEKNMYVNTGTVSYPNLVLKTSVAFTFDTENNLTGSSVVLENGEEIRTNTFFDNGLITEQHLYSTATPEQIHKSIIEYNYTDNFPTTVARAKILRSNTPAPVYDSVSFQYNDADQPVEMLFDNGDTITMEYENGVMVRSEDTILSNDTRGNVVAIEDGNGHSTLYEYDDFGRNTKITNALAEEILFTFTGWNLTRVEMGKTTEQTGRITDFVYDDYGRLLQSSIDHAGSPVFEETFTYDSDGNLLSVKDQQNRTITATYDPWGHILTSTDANSNTTSYFYSELGQLISKTNALGQATTFDYDKLNRPIRAINPLDGTTELTYNELGKVVKIIDAEHREFTFGYDLAGQTLWQKTPISDPLLYQYDCKGRIRQLTLADGTSNTYQYNSHNQLQKVTLASGTDESSTLRYGYDKAGNLLWYSDSSMGLEPLFNMTYDALNRLQTKTITPINKTLQLAYNPQGQRQELTVLENSTELFHYSYGYDSAGRLSSLTEEQQSVTRTTGFSSDSSGFLISKSYPNGVTASLNYSDNGLLDDLHYRKLDSSTIDHFEYTHDVLGRLTEVTDNLGTATFGYDVLSNLATADYPVTSNLTGETFTYDQTGNRLTSSGILDWTYDESGKLVSYNGHVLSYDHNGRQQEETASAETIIYTYDNLNRLTEVQQTGQQSIYNYGYANRRVKKTVNSNSTWYLYDGANILAEFDQSGQLIKNYNYMPGTFDLLAVTEGTVSNTVLTNHLQTPQYVLNNSQSVLWQASYQTYGKGLIDNDVDNNGTAVSLNQRFPGQYSDAETGLYYNWNRFYNPETGRYISNDPIGINGGINLYGYAGSSPLNYIDPTGLVCEEAEKFDKRNELIVGGVKGMLGYGGLVGVGYGMIVAGAAVGGSALVAAAGVVIVPIAFTGAVLSGIRVVGGLTASSEKDAVRIDGDIANAELLVGPVSAPYVLMGDQEGAKEGRFLWENKTEIIPIYVITGDADITLDMYNVLQEAKQNLPTSDRAENMRDAMIKATSNTPPPTTSVEGRTYGDSERRIGKWLGERMYRRNPVQTSSQIKTAPGEYFQAPGVR